MFWGCVCSQVCTWTYVKMSMRRWLKRCFSVWLWYELLLTFVYCADYYCSLCIIVCLFMFECMFYHAYNNHRIYIHTNRNNIRHNDCFLHHCSSNIRRAIVINGCISNSRANRPRLQYFRGPWGSLIHFSLFVMAMTFQTARLKFLSKIWMFLT